MRGFVVGAALAAFLVATPAFAANTAFDGEWVGGSGCTKPTTEVDMKVTNGEVSGTSKYNSGTDELSGTVDTEGNLVGGRAGRADLAGRFEGEDFTGYYHSNRGCISHMNLQRKK